MNLCSCFTGRKSLEDCVYDCNSYQLCRIWKSPGRAAQVFYSLILTNHDTNHVQSSFWTLPTFLNSTQQMCTLAWGEGEKCLILINDFFFSVGGGWDGETANHLCSNKILGYFCGFRSEYLLGFVFLSL